MCDCTDTATTLKYSVHVIQKSNKAFIRLYIIKYTSAMVKAHRIFNFCFHGVMLVGLAIFGG